MEEKEERGEKKEGGEQKRKKEGEAGLSEAAEKDAPVCLCKTFSRRARKGTEAANVHNTLFHFFWEKLKMFQCEQCESNTSTVHSGPNHREKGTWLLAMEKALIKAHTCTLQHRTYLRHGHLPSNSSSPAGGNR